MNYLSFVPSAFSIVRVPILLRLKVDVPSRGTVERHKMLLKSEDGPINLFLLNQDESKRSKVPACVSEDNSENVRPDGHLDVSASARTRKELPKHNKAFLGDLRSRSICELLNGHFVVPKSGGGPEAAQHEPSTVSGGFSLEQPYLKELLSPTASYNLLMGTQEGSRNLFDIDIDASSPDYFLQPYDVASDVIDVDEKPSRHSGGIRRVTVED
jgi:hypothetical protein